MGARFEDFIFWKASFISEEQQPQILKEHNDLGFHADTKWGNIWIAHDGVLKIDWLEHKE